MTPRREFLGLAAAALAAPALWPQAVAAQQAAPDDASPASGLITGRLKPLRYAAVKGFLSAEQVALHHREHYGGALRTVQAAEQALAATRAGTGPLPRIPSGAVNSVWLHERYFDGLSAEGGDPAAEAARVLTARFGSVDRWLADFVDAAKAARGWALLVRHPVGGRLYNVVSDSHDDDVVVSGEPLVVIDCYEHAYYVDYRNRKAAYADAFPRFIDWAEVERRLTRAR